MTAATLRMTAATLRTTAATLRMTASASSKTLADVYNGKAMSETLHVGPPELGIQTAPLGVGAWPWGSRWYWGYGKSFGAEDVRGAFRASLEAGVSLFDTAELYGRGESERILGRLIREWTENGASNQPVIATKFLPVPWRVRPGDLHRALRGSLRRLGVESVGLYQIHWPIPPARLRLRQWISGLITAHGEGLVKAVGVSNFDADLMRYAHELLSRAGIPLASNQLPYSLLDRHIEREGLLGACRELGVTVISYSPLAEGLLTGTYTPDNRPAGYRGWRLRKKVGRVQPIIGVLRDIAAQHHGPTPAQVALRWLIQKGTIPIPGAKTARQATDNAGALGWSLTGEDMAVLDEASSRV